jgi:hypothetical protein
MVWRGLGVAMIEEVLRSALGAKTRRAVNTIVSALVCHCAHHFEKTPYDQPQLARVRSAYNPGS